MNEQTNKQTYTKSEVQWCE